MRGLYLYKGFVFNDQMSSFEYSCAAILENAADLYNADLKDTARNAPERNKLREV